MAETFFGPGPQLWPPAMPLAGLGHIQPFPASPVLGTPHAAMSAQPPAFLSAAMPSAPMVVSSSLPDSVQMAAVRSAPGPGGGQPPLGALEFAPGITAQALLAAVALRRGQPMGPANDQEIEDFVYDALDLLSGTNDVEVRCEGGRAQLTGVVPHKRVKRDVGEIVWAIPSVNDVQNNLTIAARRRSRGAGREAETAAGTGAARKQA